MTEPFLYYSLPHPDQRVIFERYYASLLIVECKVGLGIAGLEPATIRLKAQCSTN